MPAESVQRIAESFRKNRERFEQFCRSLSEEELERPVPDSEWRVKDFVTHLATLDVLPERWFAGVAAGRSDEPLRREDGQPLDVDAWNNAAVAERRDWKLEQLLDEAAANRKRFLEALAGLDDEQIEQTVRFPGDNKRPPADVPLKLFLWGLARHDPIHVADMIKALPERAADPEIKAWLDDAAVRWYQETMSKPQRVSSEQ